MKIKKIAMGTGFALLSLSNVCSMDRIRGMLHRTRQQAQTPASLDEVVVHVPEPALPARAPEHVRIVERISKSSSVQDFGRFHDVAHRVLEEIKEKDEHGRIMRKLSERYDFSDAGGAAAADARLRVDHAAGVGGGALDESPVGYDRRRRRHSVSLMSGPAVMGRRNALVRDSHRRGSAALVEGERARLFRLVAQREADVPDIDFFDDGEELAVAYAAGRLPRSSVLMSGPAVMARGAATVSPSHGGGSRRGSEEIARTVLAHLGRTSSLREFDALAQRGRTSSFGRRGSDTPVLASRRGSGQDDELAHLYGLSAQELEGALRELVLQRVLQEQEDEVRETKKKVEDQRVAFEMYRDKQKGYVCKISCRTAAITGTIGAVVAGGIALYTQLSGGNG